MDVKYGSAVTSAGCGNKLSERGMWSDKMGWGSNESVHERCGLESQADGIYCGVVEWVKRNMLRWFGHIETMGSEEFGKKVYMSENVGSNSRGRPLERWRGRVKEYMCERGATRVGGLN